MSAKTSAQPGRRTPLSLSGTVTKNTQSKSGSNSANSSNNNANSHTTSNNNKQDNKFQNRNEIQIIKSSDPKDNPNKKQQLQTDKKQQQNDAKKSNERGQNGANSIKQSQPSENKHQQQIKDKQQQKHGSDEKDKKEKSDKLENQQGICETQDSNNVKDENKVEQEKLDDNKNEEKKTEGVKETEEEKNDAVFNTDAKPEHQGTNNYDKKSKDDENQAKTEHLTQMHIENDKKSKEDDHVKNNYQKPEEKMDYMEIVEEENTQVKSTPITPKSSGRAAKTSITVKKTPTKGNENFSQKATLTNTADNKTLKNREKTTTIDDDEVEMQPLIIESSPTKTSKSDEVSNVALAPSATSTPGKILIQKRSSSIQQSDVQLAMQTEPSPTRPRAFCEITGRRSIRPISDYTPSKFQSNLQYRESYRRINTELDVTNTSMNVTVGSEAPNNLSFSFFGRGRKRDRTPQHSQSAVGELQSETEVSPPKKARLDVNGFLSAVSSPLLLLRNRFSKASLQSSTPVKLQQKLNTAEDDIEVQNVSGETVHEEVAKSDKDYAKANTLVNGDTDATLGEEAKENISKTDTNAPTSSEACAKGKDSKDVLMPSGITCGFEQTYEQSDIKITETLLQPTVGDPMAKNKRCTVM